MSHEDYTLTVEDVSKLLAKSIRTIHRYKDSGRLSFVVGTTHGNPIYFSRSEVETFAREMYPGLRQQQSVNALEPAFLKRLERVEQLLKLLEANPDLERMLKDLAGGQASSPRALGELSRQVTAIERQPDGLERQELGGLLVRLGQALLND